MIQLNYVCILRRNDDFLLFETENLNFIKKSPISNYWTILNELDIPLSKPENNISNNISINENSNNRHLTETFSGDNGSKIRADNYNLAEISKDNVTISEVIKKEVKGKDNSNDIRKSESTKKLRPFNKENNQQILENLINPEDRENLNCGVPETIKYEGDLIKPGKFIYFYFVLNQSTALICITNQFYNDLRKFLIEFLRQFHAMFDIESIASAKKKIDTPKLIMKFCEIFAELIISDHLIPKFPSEENHLQDEDEKDEIPGLQSLISKLREDIQSIYDFLPTNERVRYFESLLEFSNKIDGISNIKTISEKLKIPLKDFKKNLLFLWMNKEIKLEIPVYGWEIFERTHKANVYLLDGSDEQKNLIEKHGGGKIISLLSRFDGKSSLLELKRKINITDLKFTRFVFELLNENLIILCESYPKMTHIEEDVIPLLVIQGLSDDDITIIELLENLCDGTKTITEIGFDLDQSPEKIKTLLDKIPEYVRFV